MDDYSMPVLIDAKNEYMKQVCTHLYIPVYKGLLGIYKEAKDDAISRGEPAKTLVLFQEYLAGITKWAPGTIKEAHNYVVKDSGCDYLDDLLSAVFVAQAKILTSVRTTQKQKKINLVIPRLEVFIHKVYIECAREFWKSPYLFSDFSIAPIEQQRNLRECEKIVKESIQETIRKMLPVKNILKEYLGENIEEADEEPTDITKNMSKKEENDIKKIIRKEIENYQTINTVAGSPAQSITETKHEDVNLRENADLRENVDLEDLVAPPQEDIPSINLGGDTPLDISIGGEIPLDITHTVDDGGLIDMGMMMGGDEVVIPDDTPAPAINVTEETDHSVSFDHSKDQVMLIPPRPNAGQPPPDDDDDNEFAIDFEVVEATPVQLSDEIIIE
ncbi:MAG: hypothetical protein F2563_03175 [Actinobacteria bacterium]|uniref:Unannotated protein n=1 Tax=freshwater metagenome TaxID=449393 RepID=A0A6J6EP08_9ZZZZ|nr:hypothetical protein [Actinomycetota bacterium]